MQVRYPLLRSAMPLLVLVAMLLMEAGVAYACPNCKAGMSTNDPHAKSMAAGYYYSILFMLSMPFLIVTSFSCWMYFAVRKAKAERAAKAAARNSVDERIDEPAETVSAKA